MSEALSTLIAHGFGHLRQHPDGHEELTLSFAPRKGERLTDMEARVAAVREDQDTIQVVVARGRIARIDLIRRW